jgi:hypothetical protein
MAAEEKTHQSAEQNAAERYGNIFPMNPLLLLRKERREKSQLVRRIKGSGRGGFVR